MHKHYRLADFHVGPLSHPRTTAPIWTTASAAIGLLIPGAMTLSLTKARAVEAGFEDAAEAAIQRAGGIKGRSLYCAFASDLALVPFWGVFTPRSGHLGGYLPPRAFQNCI